jgi:hypothetical protein
VTLVIRRLRTWIDPDLDEDDEQEPFQPEQQQQEPGRFIFKSSA